MFGFNNLTPYNRNQKESFLDSFFNDSFMPFVFNGELKTDIQEDEAAYSVTVELPGAQKENIAIDYNDNEVLTVSVNKEEEKKEEGSGYIRRERRSGMSKREYYLPNVDSAEITAKYDNGILKIHLPKNKEKKSETKIKID